jgi:hypothetical protein
MGNQIISFIDSANSRSSRKAASPIFYIPANEQFSCSGGNENQNAHYNWRIPLKHVTPTGMIRSYNL